MIWDAKLVLLYLKWYTMITISLYISESFLLKIVFVQMHFKPIVLF